METGLLNFHDDENFSTSIYDQGELSGMDGQSSLLDMMQSDLQYSSDYNSQSCVHWDNDQEQEHNGDLVVLPMAPSDRSTSESSSSSRDDYHKVYFDWQEHLLTLHPLDPDDVDVRLDGHAVPTELPENIFDDTTESIISLNSDTHHSCGTPPPRSSTPIHLNAQQSPPKTSMKYCQKASESEPSLSLDVSMSALDMNVSGIDMSALGINVSSLDIKAESGDISDPELLIATEELASVKVEPELMLAAEELVKDKDLFSVALGERDDADLSLSNSLNIKTDMNALVSIKDEPTLLIDEGVLGIDKLAHSDVEQLHALALEYIKEEQAKTQAQKPLVDLQIDTKADLDTDVDVETVAGQIPVLEAGNLQSLLEQFEATEAVNPLPDHQYSQSMPASPLHQTACTQGWQSVPTSPAPSVPSTPTRSSKTQSPPQVPLNSNRSSTAQSASSVLPIHLPTRKSSLHQNIKDALPAEVMNRIKASGRKKAIPVIPAMPSKKMGKLATRMQEAGATLCRNKLLKIVSPKGAGGESVQLDHDYCSNETPRSFYHSNPADYVTQLSDPKVKVNRRLCDDWDDEKNSRKDSGLESGDVSEDSEGTSIPLISSSGCETIQSNVSTSSTANTNGSRFIKTKIPGPGGRNKELLMVSVLKKINCDVNKKASSNSGSTPVILSPSKLSTAPSSAALNPVVLEPIAQPKEEERPKKRKLNLEEYRNRLKALEQDREKKESGNNVNLNSDSKETNGTGGKEDSVIKQEGNTEEVQTKGDKSQLKSADSGAPVLPSEQKEGHSPKQCEDNMFDGHEERRRRRQYRARHSSSSSSEASIQSLRCVRKSNDTRRSNPKKSIWANSKSRSRSRSASSSSESSSRSSRSSSNSSTSSSNSSTSSRSSKSNSSRSCCSSKRFSSKRSSRSRLSSYKSRSRSGRRSGRSHSSRSQSRSQSRRRRLSWRRRDSRSRSSYRRGRRKIRKGSKRGYNTSRSSLSRSRSHSRTRSRSKSYCGRSSTRSRSRRRYRSYSTDSHSSTRSRSLSKARSRSRSHSRSSSWSSGSWSRSRSRSLNKQRDRSYRPVRAGGAKRSVWRSRSPVLRRPCVSDDWTKVEKEHRRQVEERRVIYVGRIPEETSKADLRRRFEMFGPVVDISLHFREHADNYGFVTFGYKVDAYAAVEHGNDDPSLPRYDLCFGGRRRFCRERYADLDGMACTGSNGDFISRTSRPKEENTFDQMLREAQAKLRERNKE